MYQADLAEDHSCALKASLNLSANWTQPRGCSCQTWQPRINDDLNRLTD